VLAVGGTPGNDLITFMPANTAGSINVMINGVQQGTFLPSGRIFAFGGAGDDTLLLLPNSILGRLYFITVPGLLDGGDGNDVLHALAPDMQVDTLDCGPGDHDVAWIRAGEPDVTLNCEVVHTVPREGT